MSDPMENAQSAEETVPSGEAPEEERPAAPEETAGNTVSPAEEKETADPAGDEAEKLRSDLAAEKEKYLRLAAEYDNYRKRSARERDNIYADVKADFDAVLADIRVSTDRFRKLFQKGLK